MSKKDKPCYKITNWAKYNEALVNRGDLTFWISNEVIQEWKHKNNVSVHEQLAHKLSVRSKKRGTKAKNGVSRRRQESVAACRSNVIATPKSKSP